MEKIAIITGIVAMLVMAMGVILFVVLYQRRVIRHHEELNKLDREKEREVLQASINGEENERMRIASELHDDIGATLASVKLYLHSYDKQGDDNSKLAASSLLIDETLDKVRNISHRLQPSMLKHLGLKKTLISFFSRIGDSGKISTSYSIDDLPMLSEELNLAIYRIVQELTNNTLKHAGANEMSISLSKQNEHLVLLFSHNGNGLSYEAYKDNILKKHAMGLKNIYTRLKTINADITFEQLHNKHHTSITIPL